MSIKYYCSSTLSCCLLLQEEASARADLTRSSHLSQLSSQLLLLEARLLRKRRDIDMLLGQRDTTIARQARAISLLQSRLSDAGLDATADVELDVDSPLDSLNDSDSAVVLEDDHFGSRSMSSRSVFRSVSDAAEPMNKHSRSRNNGFLRRPEVNLHISILYSFQWRTTLSPPQLSLCCISLYYRRFSI